MDKMLRINLWQQVSCGFQNRILHLCKQRGSGYESHGFSEKKCVGVQKIYNAEVFRRLSQVISHLESSQRENKSAGEGQCGSLQKTVSVSKLPSKKQEECSCITGTSLSDCLVSYRRHLFGGGVLFFSEKQLVSIIAVFCLSLPNTQPS